MEKIYEQIFLWVGIFFFMLAGGLIIGIPIWPIPIGFGVVMSIILGYVSWMFGTGFHAKRRKKKLGE